MRYKALVFDFFGVICNEIGSPWLAEHNLGDSEEEIERAADLGIQSQADHFKQLSELSGVPAPEIEREWEGRARFNVELMALIKEWQKECKIGLLSNAPLPFFQKLFVESGFVPYFDATVVSSEIGHAKPDPMMYEAILEKLGVRPEEALMIDDREENIVGAKAVGMDGILYTSVEDLKRALGSV